jgi:hypothetical protein
MFGLVTKRPKQDSPASCLLQLSVLGLGLEELTVTAAYPKFGPEERRSAPTIPLHASSNFPSATTTTLLHEAACRPADFVERCRRATPKS